jgi:16S rRNA (guanine(966)-N(2))-methyltransferase RsmD
MRPSSPGTHGQRFILGTGSSHPSSLRQAISGAPSYEAGWRIACQSRQARGRRRRSVPGDATRPITDRAKESLFNILGSDVIDATLLDLFAGTGSVGIEALSRGAAYARFIDLQRQAIETVRANLQTTGLNEAAEVIRQDAFTSLERPADRAFDYVFIAPPQYKGLWEKALRLLDARPGWLSADAWVIVQFTGGQALVQNLVEFDQRKYGSVLFVFYERKPADN